MNVFTIIRIQIIVFLFQTVLCIEDMRVITSLKYSKNRLTPAVVNGKPATESQFPFLVSIKEPLQELQPDKIVWRNLCGGSIIARTLVLTAAHCFVEDDFTYVKNPHFLRVVAGNLNTDIVHDGHTETTTEGQWRTILKMILHQGYNFPDDDIAIAVVDEPWVYTKKVNYVRMATSSTDYHHCTTAGYGTLGNKPDDKISPILLTAEIETVSKERCSSLFEMNMDKFICTATAITEVARGDSGGPLICRRTGDPEGVNNEGILVGIVSGKNVDTTTLYTRVSEFRTWIAINGEVSGGGGSASGVKESLRRSNAADTLHMSVNVFWSITLFVFIYLLFYC